MLDKLTEFAITSTTENEIERAMRGDTSAARSLLATCLHLLRYPPQNALRHLLRRTPEEEIPDYVIVAPPHVREWLAAAIQSILQGDDPAHALGLKPRHRRVEISDLATRHALVAMQRLRNMGDKRGLSTLAQEALTNLPDIRGHKKPTPGQLVKAYRRHEATLNEASGRRVHRLSKTLP